MLQVLQSFSNHSLRYFVIQVPVPGLGFPCAHCAGSRVAQCCQRCWAQQTPHQGALSLSPLVSKVPGFGHGQKQLMRFPPQADLSGVAAGGSPRASLGCALCVLLEGWFVLLLFLEIRSSQGRLSRDNAHSSLSGGAHAQNVSAYALPPVAAGRCRGWVCPRPGQLQATTSRPASLGQLQHTHPQLPQPLLLPVQGGFHKVQVYLCLVYVDQSKSATARGTGSSQRQEEEMWEAKRSFILFVHKLCF